MHIKVTQQFDENYYEEYYSEWLHSRSKRRKWQPQIGVLLLTVAFLIFIIDDQYFLVMVFAAISGIISIYDFYATKRAWMNDRKSSKMNNQSATLIFEDDEIQSNGPFTQVKAKWSFWVDIIETEKGLFLVQESKTSTYLQKTSFDNPSDIKLIMKKFESLKLS